MTISIICFTIIVLLYLGIITENNYICPAIHLLHTYFNIAFAIYSVALKPRKFQSKHTG